MPQAILDEFLAPLKKLSSSKTLLERVQGLEEYYRQFCRRQEGQDGVIALLEGYEQFFAGIDTKTVVEKEGILKKILLHGQDGDGKNPELPKGNSGSARDGQREGSTGISEEQLAAMERFLARPLTAYKGIGPRIAAQLEKKGLKTVRDVLFFLPYQYIDKARMTTIKDMADGQKAYFRAKVVSLQSWKPQGFFNRRSSGYLCTVTDGRDTAQLRWFHALPVFLKDSLKAGAEFFIFGKVGLFKGRKEIHHPEMELARDGAEIPDDKAGVILPVYYGLPAGVSEKLYRRLVLEIVSEALTVLRTLLPPELKERLQLIEWGEAVQRAHFPPAGYDEKLWLERRSDAHLSLIYQELFLFYSIFMERKSEFRKQAITPLSMTSRYADMILGRLQYQLTAAQKRVLAEIRSDLEKPWAMQRLLQGDVGSGKTIVALLSALLVIEAGRQVVVMAPTEILAEQHFFNFRDMLEGAGIEVALLVSGMKKKEKDTVTEGIASGRIGIVTGTHALLQEDVAFRNLGLAIIDEQHRFGVGQRGVLIAKGLTPHVLYMTATPIPRTLSLTIHGDLDLSVIDELPPTRKPVKTVILPEKERDRAFGALKDELGAGRQGYVVYPVIDEENALELKAATRMYELIREKFSGNRVGLLHGRLKSDEKETVMRAFKKRELDIIVATTVIEVGVDVPNASIMIIEHGERFGLSQLHQLRGRIGRGADEARCVVLVDTRKLSQKARERLVCFRDTRDGFKLAEFDLKLRGPGELMGTRQSGMPEFSIVDILKDGAVIEMMKTQTENYFDRNGRNTEYGRLLGRMLKMYFDASFGFARAG